MRMPEFWQQEVPGFEDTLKSPGLWQQQMRASKEQFDTMRKAQEQKGGA